jgi:glutathione S-transferase
MITIWGQAPSLAVRVIWMLEEMGLPYAVRPVDFFNRLGDAAFMAVNPAGSLPAVVEGDVVICDSTAAVVYLAERHGPTALVPTSTSPLYATYLQFLHFAESSLGGLIGGAIASRYFAPEEHRDNWAGGFCLDTCTRRTALITRQLALTPYVAGDAFTAADISIGYALSLWDVLGATDRLDPLILDYLDRIRARPAYQRAVSA